MFINKYTVNSIETMTKEERNNPELIKQRKDYKSSPISVYYGSPKKEITHTCLTCKKRNKCQECRDAEHKDVWLRNNAYNPYVAKGLTEEQQNKISHNVFIIANCIYKEKIDINIIKSDDS